SFMSKKIKLYIQEDMEVNAYAFGKRTLVLTRGSIEFLNDDCLKGLIAHELGHFAHHDTKAALLAYVGNIYVSLFLRFLAYVARLFWPFNIIYKPVVFINDIPLLVTSRRQEYHADKFAFEIGFGEEMTQVLYALYAFIIEKPGSIQEQIRRTHPALTKRIERVEYLLTEIDNIPA
ncbi:MAG: M48 family metalloprotease, partial [Clostridiales bacterium]|nr:M48 family metalloprotease [Clostridiales bacterium]